MDVVIGGKLVPGDLLVSGVIRSDMAPVPMTLDVTLRQDSKFTVNKGDRVVAGRDGLTYQVVQVSDNNDITAVQGHRAYGTTSFIAFLDSCAAVAVPRATAVVKNAATLGEIYRSCGATIPVDSDFTVSRFASFIGDVPSFRIAQVLQEEGGAVFWAAGKLKFIRLPDLFKQTPTKKLLTDSTEDLSNEFLEQHEIPFFYSTDDTGAIIFGNRDQTRTARYVPRQDQRTLTNMTRVLVLKKKFKSPYAPAINAGSVILVVDTPYAVVTAAHVYETGTDGSGSNAYSKFRLAVLGAQS